MDIHVNDVLKMKKAHPCGARSACPPGGHGFQAPLPGLRPGGHAPPEQGGEECPEGVPGRSAGGSVGFLQGSFAAAGGELLSGCPERSQRGTRGQAQIDFGCASADMTLVPWTPILRGPPIKRASRSTQRRGWTSIGFPSITAAAEGLVTFGWCSSRWKTRLLAWRGSSLAQRDGVS